jgi:5-methylcytosine-specific restriction protein B
LTISEEKKNEFLSLFREFVREYFSQPRGQEHLRRYIEARAQGRKNFEEIKDEARRNVVPTEKVLQTLLPHTESSAHRKSGAWIHIAPVIQGDVRNWFEAVGWARAEDWPKIASAILAFLTKCAEDPSTIENACRDFVSLPYTTGFQTGMLTPILNALCPDDFMIINNKSRRVINYFGGSSFKRRLTDYPGVNVAGHDLIEELQRYMQEITKSDAVPADLFDMFCHWLVAEKKFSPVRVGAGEEPPANFNSADGTWGHHADVEKRVREAIERSIPNTTMRRAALEFFASAIESADEERSTAWYVRETGRALRLMTGRLLACEVGGPKLRVSVIGPVGDDIRTDLAAEAEEDSEFKLVPGSRS